MCEVQRTAKSAESVQPINATGFNGVMQSDHFQHVSTVFGMGKCAS